MGLTFRRLSLCAALCLMGFAARADWQGDLKIDTKPPPAHGDANQTGKISGKGTKIRMDVDKPPMGHVAAIMDMKAKKAIMVMDDRKAYMETDLDQTNARGGAQAAALCDTEDAVECLKKNDYKKGGAETVNGVKADKWERDRDDARGKRHETLWVPQGVKDFAFVRHLMTSEQRTVQLDVENFKKVKLDDAQFKAPDGYQDMSAMMKQHMGGMGGPGMGGPGMSGAGMGRPGAPGGPGAVVTPPAQPAPTAPKE